MRSVVTCGLLYIFGLVILKVACEATARDLGLLLSIRLDSGSGAGMTRPKCLGYARDLFNPGPKASFYVGAVGRSRCRLGWGQVRFAHCLFRVCGYYL